MVPDINTINTFQIWMNQLKSRTDTLLNMAGNDSLEAIAKELTHLTSIWQNYLEHANRVGIDLRYFSLQTQGIIENLEKTEQILRRRQSNPLFFPALQTVLQVAEVIDNFLIIFGLRPLPLVVPIIKLVMSLIGMSQNLLSGGQSSPKLLTTLANDVLISSNNQEVVVNNFEITHKDKKTKICLSFVAINCKNLTILLEINWGNIPIKNQKISSGLLFFGIPIGRSEFRYPKCDREYFKDINMNLDWRYYERVNNTVFSDSELIEFLETTSASVEFILFENDKIIKRISGMNLFFIRK